MISLLFIPSSIVNSHISYNQETTEDNIRLRTSDALTNKQIIQEIFTELGNFYSSNACYPEIYDGSIRADYYAVYVAHSLGKLGEIDENKIKTHIMSYYNPVTNIFIDDYAKRYLDTDFDLMYFPCSTLLETNCYAVLALNLMDEMDSINIPEMIDFIWDCYDSSSGGFIGQPYSESLNSMFKTPTADNTFFAVITLNLLMGGDWSFYSNERNAIINFILRLQHPSSPIGFFNDNEHSLDSIQVYEPNIIASYYCVRILSVFNSISSMNLNLFHDFMNIIYHSDTHAFDVGVSPSYNTECDIIASAMGLELSALTNYGGCDQDGTFSFIITNLNSYSLWDASSTVKYHELTDTFQVLRSLNQVGRIEGVVLETLDPLVLYMNSLFWNGYAYSLIAKDFTSQESLNAIINAYYFYNNITALDVNELYKDLKESFEILGTGTSQFSSSLYNIHPNDNLLRSFPINYYCFGDFVQIPRLERMYTHKSMFYALDSLKKIYKLSLFEPLIDEDQIIDDIVASQFLDPTQENHGIFLDSSAPLSSDPYIRNKFAFFEYSYYAIRSLQLLVEISTSYDSIIELGIDFSAFYEFISENIVQDDQVLYFEFPYSGNSLLNLKNTYFSVYALKTIDMYELDNQKITNYVNQVLHYGSIESIYYAYKLLNILEQPITFDTTLIHQLVPDLYDPTFHQLYTNSQLEKRNWQVFAWICELATTSETQIVAQCSPEIYLGGTNAVRASLSNLIVNNPEYPDEVKFESSQLGEFIMDNQQDGTYWVELTVPIDASNYPKVQGIVKSYETGTETLTKDIEFSTTYSINQIAVDFNRTEDHVEICSELSFLTGIGERPLIEIAKVQLTVVIDGVLQPETELLNKNDFETYSRFYKDYEPEEVGNYTLNLFLDDGISSELVHIGECSFEKLTEEEDPQIIIYEDSEDSEEEEDSDDEQDDPENGPEDPDNSTENQPTEPDTDPELRSTTNPQFVEGIPLFAALISLPAGGLLIPVISTVLKRRDLSSKGIFRKRKK